MSVPAQAHGLRLENNLTLKPKFTMKRLTTILMALCTIGCGTHGSPSAASQVTMASLLDEMISYDAVTGYPAVNYRAAQVSSYDRRTVDPHEPGWFANDDGAGFERLDTIRGRVEKVLFDEKGPGAITRIWMTTNDKRGTLRFYFDGASTPEIEIPAYDMARFPVTVGEALSLTHTHYEDELSKTGGNTFFLVIDRARNSENVYMLSMIDEYDLQEFLDDEERNGKQEEETPAVVLPETKPEPTPDVEIEEPKEESSGGMNKILLLVFVAALGGAGAFFYFYIYKPKPKEETPQSENLETDQSLATVNEDSQQE